jgi:hypothetical protein
MMITIGAGPDALAGVGPIGTTATATTSETSGPIHDRNFIQFDLIGSPRNAALPR